jgi:TRAP-type C4-dicarboxylate transport system substrate-binding protein
MAKEGHMRRGNMAKVLVRLLLAMLVASAAGGPSGAQEVTLRLQHFLPAVSGPHKDWLLPWADKVGKESGGRIKIEVYPSMQLGGRAPQLFDQVKDGVIDAAWTVAGYTPGRFRRLEVFELPWVSSTSAERTSVAMWSFYEMHAQEELKDVKVLALVTPGRGVIFTKEKAVKLPEDVKGLKLRVPSRVVNDIFQAVGASPQGIPPPAVPEALAKGVIDGALFPYDAATALKLDELTNRVSDFAGGSTIYSATMLVIMNKATYERLPADLRKAIDDNAGLPFSRTSGAKFDELNTTGRNAVLKRNTPIQMIDGAELAAWRKATEPAIASWISERTRAGDKGEELVNIVRGLVAQAK